MKCAICGKNSADIHIKEVIGSDCYTLDICKECADANRILELYIELGVSHYDDIKKLNFNQTTLSKVKTRKSVKFDTNVVCKKCGYSLEEFLDVHTLSCPLCYKYFRTYLINSIKKIHNETKYIGKVPERKISIIYKQNKKKELEKHLNTLIEEESYEEASKVRDEIIKLEREISSSVYEG